MLEETGLDALANTETVRRWTRHLAGLAAVNAGGALTGYLASRSRQGALIGAAAHTTLFSAAQVTFASLTTAERIAYGVLALGGAAMTAWLFTQQKGRRYVR
jgi:hypothetical protein